MSDAIQISLRPAKVIRLGFFALFLIIPLALFFRSRYSGAAQDSSDSTARVEKRQFATTLRMNGTTQASHSFVVLAPKIEGAQLGSLIITKLVPAGSHVSKGNILAEFDPQAQTKDYIDKKSAFENLVGQVAQKQSEEDIARARDDTTMKQAENEVRRAELEMQRNEVVSRIDAEKNQESLDEARATLKQLKETYELKRAAAKANIRIQEIQRDRALEAMRYAQGNASKMTVHSPMDGVAVYNTIWLGGRMGSVQQGDQVRPGVPFLQVVDPTQMEVRVELNQVDLLNLHSGQNAHMRLDAYPGLSLAATLEEVSPLGHNGQFSETVRSFTARFSIQGTDPRLLPDLSAALDVDLGTAENALLIPSQGVVTEGEHSYVWVKASSGFEKRNVKIGPRNDLETVVVSGLSEGDLIRRTARESAAGAATR
jgi:HlyD family secretion protein